MGRAAATEAAPGHTLLSDRLLRLVPAAYLVVVIALAITRSATGHPTSNTLALTPDRLAAGKVWLFVTSGVMINGPALVQIAWLVPTLVAAQRRLGARFTVAVMIGAHVGATLLAYAVLAVFTGDADGAHNHELDYGISAVWLGTFGALWALALSRGWRRDRTATIVVVGGVCVLILSATLFSLLASTEHGLAFALGAVAVLLSGHRGQARVGWLDPAHPRRPHELRGGDR